MRYFLLIYSFLVIFSLASPAAEAAKTIPTSKEHLTLSYAPLVKKSAPAVVNIYTKKKVTVQSPSLFGKDPIFQHFFNRNNPRGNITKERVENSLGSGVIIDPKGLIITNHHVIKGSEKITILLADKREFSASISLIDERTDLAILQIETKNETFPHIEFANSDNLEVGDLVLAIGNPFGVGQTVTSGIISALSRTTAGVSDYQFFIQTDAAINPGNSGGALLTMDGKLAGINSAIYSRSGGSNGIGFATPANMASYIFHSAKTGNNKVIRPWLGVTMQKVTNDIANSFGLKKPSGALISKLHPEGTAAKAGVRIGDIITHIEKYEAEDEHALRYKIGTYPIGKNVSITLLRENKHHTISMTMEPAPEVPIKDMRTLTGITPLSGATVVNISPAISEDLRLGYYENGVVATKIKPGSLASRMGIKQKDIITSINKHTIISTQQLDSIARTVAQNTNYNRWHIRILRNGQIINYTVRK